MLALKKIAVTGGLSSGKTTVCGLLKKQGAYVVSADEIVHHLLSPHTPLGQQVIKLLGSDIVSHHQLDRKKIAHIVFSDSQKLEALEQLLHPQVLDEIEKAYQKIKHNSAYRCFVAEVPLLYEIGAEKRFDLVIAVVADPTLCRARMQTHKEDSLEDYEKRMKRQLPNKADRADVTILNNGSFEDLENQVTQILTKYL